MSSLSLYYSTIYNSTCPQTSPFLSSWPYIAYPLQYSNVVFIPLSVLSAYCIIYKTPKPMQPMKWVYLNLHFWTSVQSISLSLLIVPLCWLPTISTSTLGLLSKMGVPEVFQAYLAMSVMMLSLSSIITLFENRHHMIHQNRFKISNPTLRCTILSLNYLVSCLYVLPVFLDIIPDQESAKLSILETIPCPYPDFFTIPIFTLSSDPNTRKYIVYSTIICSVCTMLQLNFYSSTCLHYLVFRGSGNTSKTTNSLQRKFFLGILVQVSVPYGFTAPAIVYSSWAMLTGTYNSKMNVLVVLIFTLYGIVATISLLLSHRPYRTFIRETFLCNTPKINTRSLSSVLVSKANRSL